MLVATQTLTFLSADIEGPTAVSRRPGDAYAGVLVGCRRLVRAGWAEYAG